MRFNSIIYALFLGGVLVVLALVPSRWRRGWLLIASAAFYASWHPPYLALLAFVAVLNHAGARWVAAAADRNRRGALLVTANLFVLGLFKYLGWLEANVMWLGKAVGLDVRLPVASWVLPLGLSFFVFECISYVIDLMRKREKLHPFWDFLLFVAFFPKLIAGPILRAKELLPQIATPKPVTAESAVGAVWLLLTGLFLKTVVADGLAPGVDAAFAREPHGLSALDVWGMAIGFGLQIYFDFSAYSRMAIGSARLCGIELVENFNHPYVARSPADFWARWHMSLSRWIRDYVFFPMVGKSATLGRLIYAALGSMVLCGIWHGAGWTFVLWGAWHGVLVGGYHAATAGRRKAARPVPWFVGLAGAGLTFAGVMLGWLLFRAPDVSTASVLIQHAFLLSGGLQHALPGSFLLQVGVATLAVWAAPAVGGGLARFAASLPPAVALVGRGVAWGLLIAVSLVYLRGQTSFVYFQF
jgi:D-alanyl-lipoteichoic acid acyltransferase DltB (MBOAT superfamily)